MRYFLSLLCFSLTFFIGVSSASIVAFIFTEDSSQLILPSLSPDPFAHADNQGLHFTALGRGCKGGTGDGGFLGYVQTYKASDGSDAAAGSYGYATLAKTKAKLSRNAREGRMIEQTLSKEVEFLMVEMPDQTIMAYQRKGKVINWISAPSRQHVEILKGVEGWARRE